MEVAENEILTVNPMQLTVGAVRDAIYSPWRGPRERARSYILGRIIDGLDPDSTLKLAEYEKQENPCEGEK